MKIDKDSARISFPPPFVYLGFLLLGLAADTLLPELGLPHWARLIGGAALAVGGLAANLFGVKRFSQAGNNLEPWRPANLVVTTGIYRYTRNPMYLGMALIYLGVMFGFDSLGMLILFAPLIIVIRTQVIAREEDYLEAKFGEKYLAYRRQVRRWL